MDSMFSRPHLIADDVGDVADTAPRRLSCAVRLGAAVILSRTAMTAVILLAALGGLLPAGDDEPIPPARRTETVQLIAQTLPAVVSLIQQRVNPDGQREGRFGSGSVIHPLGFILTNHHVVAGLQEGGAVVGENRLMPIRLVAAFPHEDLAVVQLKTDTPVPTIPLGRSDDLLLGEPALVIGTPGGLVQSVSTGIVSGINRSTRNESNFLPWMIQTSAPVSRGNSGGPLINALGQQIGVVSTSQHELQNVSFAIAIDHVRRVLPAMLAMEARRDLWLGVECDPLVDAAIITAIAPGSPAEAAGLQIGDRLLRLGAFEVNYGCLLQLALYGRQAGDELEVQFLRGEQTQLIQVKLTPMPTPEPAVVEQTAPGLRHRLYRGSWERLPDFSALEPIAQGSAPVADLSFVPEPRDEFGLRFDGWVQAPRDGVYAFYTRSDDGSRLWIGARLVVDNDGQHPTRETGGLVRLRAGLHPLRVDYFERQGNEFLEVWWEGPGIHKSRLPAEAVVSQPAPEAAATSD